MPLSLYPALLAICSVLGFHIESRSDLLGRGPLLCLVSEVSLNVSIDSWGGVTEQVRSFEEKQPNQLEFVPTPGLQHWPI